MLKPFLLLENADDLVENTWRNHGWFNLVYFGLVIVIALMVIAYLFCMIGGAIFLEGERLWLLARSWFGVEVSATLASIPSQYVALNSFSMAYAGVTGFFSLVSLAPAMLIKGVSTHLSHVLFSFEGRINRNMWLLTTIAVAAICLALVVAIYLLGGVVGENAHPVVRAGLDLLWLVLVVLTLPVIWIALALGTKRLHDRDKSALWLVLYVSLSLLLYVASLIRNWESFSLYLVIAAVAVALLGLAEIGLMAGNPGPNRYGPEPRDQPA